MLLLFSNFLLGEKKDEQFIRLAQDMNSCQLFGGSGRNRNGVQRYSANSSLHAWLVIFNSLLVTNNLRKFIFSILRLGMEDVPKPASH